MRNSLLSQGCQIDSQYIVSVLGLHQEINVKSLMQYKSDISFGYKIKRTWVGYELMLTQWGLSFMVAEDTMCASKGEKHAIVLPGYDTMYNNKCGMVMLKVQ